MAAEEDNAGAVAKVAAIVRSRGLYFNFDNQCGHDPEGLAAELERYFKPAGGLCECFRYSNPANTDIKNSIVRILPEALDVVEPVGKEWLRDNLLDYFKAAALAYCSAWPDRHFLLCASKAFKQVVLLEPRYLENSSGRHVVLQSNSALDGRAFATKSLEYAIVDSCFYSKTSYYRGIDWGTDGSDERNNAIIGYTRGPYYNPLMYTFEVGLFRLTNFSWTISGLLKDYVEITKWEKELKIQTTKELLSKAEEELRRITRNASRTVLEGDILGG